MRAKHDFALLTAFALCAGACSETPRSCDLDNASLVLRATVSDLAHGVEVEVEIESEPSITGGIGTALALCPEADVLTVNGVDTEEVLALGHLYYTAEFSTRESSYEIALARKDHEDVVVVVDMPPSFEILTPASAGESFSRAEALDITWAPGWPGEVIELNVSDEIGSTCIEGLGVEFDVEDSGSYSLAPHALSGGGGVSECEATISLTRMREVEYPAQLAPDGQISAIVKRRLSFISID